MIYDKPSLTFDEQAELLLSRGLIADGKELVDLLKVVNYYRFSGYLYTFRNFNSEPDSFINNTKLADVLEIYEFDKSLRFLLFEGLKRIEVCFKTRLAYFFLQVLGKVGSAIVSFGSVGHVFVGVENSLKREISACFEVEHGVLISWIKSLCYIRNLCAHHSRVWNRVLAIKPKIPNKKKVESWKDVKNNKIFCVILIIAGMLKSIGLSDDWTERAQNLFNGNRELLSSMGFPENWGRYFR